MSKKMDALLTRVELRRWIDQLLDNWGAAAGKKKEELSQGDEWLACKFAASAWRCCWIGGDIAALSDGGGGGEGTKEELEECLK